MYLECASDPRHLEENECALRKALRDFENSSDWRDAWRAWKAAHGLRSSFKQGADGLRLRIANTLKGGHSEDLLRP